MLEMLGKYLLVLSASEVEFVLREMLAQSTYPFAEGGLQFLAMERVEPKFSLLNV